MSGRLEVRCLHAGYGRSMVLHNINLAVDAGRSLAILGHNGAGKSTLLATLAGITQQHQGQILLDGYDLSERPPYARTGHGLAWVPQERAVFATLTVQENLTTVARSGPWTEDDVYALFPRLAERRQHFGNQLSGGEQQMLAIARALVLNPRVLMLDEPLEGLAPLLAEQLLATLGELIRQRAMTVLIVEQDPCQVLPITDDAIIMQRGQVVHQAPSKALMSDASTLRTWLTV